jgi:hypothetical protein
VFRWETNTVIDSDDMHYAVMLNPDGDGELAGIMDGSGFAPASKWGVYWHVDDADATVARAKKLGGAVTLAPEATPYGTLAVLTDPAGAEFKLRQPNP